MTIADPAKQYGRYDYRRVIALPHAKGYSVNQKRVERIWRWENLKVLQRHSKCGRLRLDGGSCIRLRREFPKDACACDFAEVRNHDRQSFPILAIIDEAKQGVHGSASFGTSIVQILRG